MSAAFLLGFCGMMIGLTLDLQSVLPEALAALCTGNRTLADSMLLHASLLPAANLLMLVGSLVGAGLGRGRWSGRIACCALMLVGMGIFEWLGPRLAGAAGLSWTFPAMVAAMTLGMAAGMALCALPQKAATRLPLRLSTAGSTTRIERAVSPSRPAR
ncbi:hypothetical protein ABLE91_20865 [Aquabacter sp. CN5-332]|uniref:hypothetical protein n=1 Tax=Aquabacter sp. CN5-332 TaxID=3156608 RepID=UPI0032B4B549